MSPFMPKYKNYWKKWSINKIKKKIKLFIPQPYPECLFTFFAHLSLSSEY